MSAAKSILRPEVSAWLRKVGIASPPLFSNMVLAEGFAARNRRGPFSLLPRTDGRFALVDERLPVGARTVDTFASEKDAHARLLGCTP